MRDLFVSVKTAIDKYDMFTSPGRDSAIEPESKPEPIVVGISGGPDSMSLLHILHRLSDSYKTSLVPVHVNHCLRGTESDSDAYAVVDFCSFLGLDCRVILVDVRSRCAITGESEEMAARHLRYAAFAEVAIETGALIVAVGHTRDDNVETVLIRVIRGTGPAGLGGIPAVRVGLPALAEARVVRPLIDSSRSAVEEYCSEWNLPVVLDSSNTSSRFVRNKVRNELLPLLEMEYNPSVRDALTRLSSICRDDETYLTGVAEKELLLATVSSESTGVARLDARSVARLPASVRRRMLRLVLEKMGHEPDFSQVEKVWQLLQEAEGGKQVELGGGIVARLQSGCIELRHGGLVRPGSSTWSVNLTIPGVTILPTGERLAVESLDEVPSLLETSADCAYIDADICRIDEGLVARSRKPGDRFVPFGRHTLVKVKEYLIDSKVAVEERSDIPVVESSTGICWLAGLRADERFRVTPGAKKVLKMRLLPAQPDICP